MANSNLQADSADRNDVRANLLNFQINGVSPAISHGDATTARLEEAHAVLTVLSFAFEDAATVGRETGDRIPITHLNERLIARAIEGAASLVAYASYHATQGEEA